MQVAGIALKNGATEDEAIAVLLHDVMEDQDVSEAELTRRFGPEVAAIVAGCSDSASTEKAPWHKRKEAYIARATLADYQEIGEPLWGRLNASPENILWYYQSPASAFQEAQERHGEPSIRVLRELSVVVAELAGQTSITD